MLISNDSAIVSKFKENKYQFKNLFIKSNENYLCSYLDCNINLEILIIDLDMFYKLEEEIDFATILSIAPNQQFIFLAKNKQIYRRMLENFFKGGGSSALLIKPFKYSLIIDNILLLTPNLKPIFLNLNKNIKIDLIKERIYDDKEQIFLTNLHHKLILLLSQNANNLTTFSMIDDVVYNGECSNQTCICNLVGTLKRKLNLRIKNVPSKGYILEC